MNLLEKEFCNIFIEYCLGELCDAKISQHKGHEFIHEEYKPISRKTIKHRKQ